jgi:hypothetical protein
VTGAGRIRFVLGGIVEGLMFSLVSGVLGVLLLQLVS